MSGMSDVRLALRSQELEMAQEQVITAPAPGRWSLFWRRRHTRKALLDLSREQLRDIGLTAEQAAQLVIAYEPVWAIGTGEVAGPEDAQEMCAAIRAELVELFDDETAAKTRLLYGGSVKANNVGAIMAERDVDGVLVGGASLDAGEFGNIARFENHLVTK